MPEKSDLPAGTLTFLYTDIEGSTRLWEEYPKLIREAVSQHDRILRIAVEKNGGKIFRTTGDGICAVFIHATDALAAALVSQLELFSEKRMRPVRFVFAWYYIRAKLRYEAEITLGAASTG